MVMSNVLTRAHPDVSARDLGVGLLVYARQLGEQELEGYRY
jgi:hypothetical protein